MGWHSPLAGHGLSVDLPQAALPMAGWKPVPRRFVLPEHLPFSKGPAIRTVQIAWGAIHGYIGRRNGVAATASVRGRGFSRALPCAWFPARGKGIAWRRQVFYASIGRRRRSLNRYSRQIRQIRFYPNQTRRFMNFVPKWAIKACELQGKRTIQAREVK